MSTAVFGGTFDPVHKGHLAIVQSALNEFGLGKIVIVPNGNPPHKKDSQVTDFSHRYNMLRLAFDSVDRAEISDYEAGETRYRYSLDTMRYFRSLYGDETYFIIGADSLLTIHTWYKYRTLLRENRFIVFRRAGDGEINRVIDEYSKYAKEILVSAMPMYDASSTKVRSNVESGALEPGILTQEVYNYIKEHRLYGGML